MHKVEVLKEHALEHIKSNLENAIMESMVCGETCLSIKEYIPETVITELTKAGYKVTQSIFGKNKDTKIEWGNLWD